jgi:hypothetical protein
MLEFLFSPIDPIRAHDVGMTVSWHGRLMVFAWGVLLPLGVFAARFCKVLPGQNWPKEIQNPFWFTWHRILQYTGLAFMVGAVILIWFSPQNAKGLDLHGWIGWSVVTLAAIQFLAALLKGTGGGPDHNGPGQWGGDHFMMRPIRVVFEKLHKFLGYLAIGVSVVSILTGMWIANAYVWMWIAQIGIWIGLVLLFVVLQKRGWTIDTYQAIWGTDPSFPGNQLPPVGWGIRRGPALEHSQTVNIKKQRMAARGKTAKRH